MTVTRWTVRACKSCGEISSGERGARWCPDCRGELGPEFDVVRAVGARTSDPSTSQLAAWRAEPRMATQRGRLLSAIRDAGRGGLTANEAMRETGISGGWRRVSELHQGGHIVAIGERLDRYTRTDGAIFVAKEYAPPPPPVEDPGGQMGLL